MAEEDDREAMQRRLRARLGRVGHKILVLSGKGGVGKSTVAVNLAAALQATGRSVGLLDIDIHGPSVPRMLGIEDRSLHGSEEGILPIRHPSGLLVVSIGCLLPDLRSPVIWRGPRKFGAIRQFLADVVWGELDFLVIDSPPGTGDEPLAACELTEEELPRPPGRRPDRGAVIVTTPQGVAISDVRRCVAFCQELGLPIHGLLENMSGFVCPECGTEVDIFRRGGGEALAREEGIPLLGRIPLEAAIVEAGELGRPLDERTRSGAVFAAVAREIRERAAEGRVPATTGNGGG